MKCVIKILLVCENDYNMTQDEKWMIRYDEVVGFIEANHRNPSKHRVEEHLMLNWVKLQWKLMNAGKLKPGRVGKFSELIQLIEQYKRVNQYQLNQR